LKHRKKSDGVPNAPQKTKRSAKLTDHQKPRINSYINCVFSHYEAQMPSCVE